MKGKSTLNMYTYHIKEMMYVNGSRITLVKFCVLTALFLFILLTSLLPFIISSKFSLNVRPTRYAQDLKYILFWNHPVVRRLHSSRVKEVLEFETGQNMFIKQKCKYYNCYISYNESLLGGDQSNYDAVVFNVHDISKFKVGELNFTRSPSQKFIFRSHDPAETNPVCNTVFDDFFNWTWTYKLNSDIPHPFVNIYDTKNNLVGPKRAMDWLKTMHHTPLTNGIMTKKKAVVWVIQRCKLKRKHQDFIAELKKELKGYNLTLDLYGPCGEKTCPGGQLSQCYKMAEKKYFFQLLLEDSFIEDYVTEKLVKILSYFTVPIVQGNIDYTRFIPPGAYINAQLFDIKKLGALIDYLIKNPSVYEYFFDWKNHYFYTTNHRANVCDLCAKLNGREVYDSYPNFRKWWNLDYTDVCERLHLLNMFNT